MSYYWFRNIQGLHNKIGCKIGGAKNDLCDDIEIFVETW